MTSTFSFFFQKNCLLWCYTAENFILNELESLFMCISLYKLSYVRSKLGFMLTQIRTWNISRIFSKTKTRILCNLSLVHIKQMYWLIPIISIIIDKNSPYYMKMKKYSTIIVMLNKLKITVVWILCCPCVIWHCNVVYRSFSKLVILWGDPMVTFTVILNLEIYNLFSKILKCIGTCTVKL